MPGGGTQTQTQRTRTEPWRPTINHLEQILQQYGSLHTTPTARQDASVESLWDAARDIPNLGMLTAGNMRDMLRSNTNQEQNILMRGYGTLQDNIGGIAAGEGLNPYETPGFADALSTMTGDITDRVKGVYAGSGRSPSGAGSFAGSLGRGLTEGLAPTIAAQYNQNRANQMSAANNLFGGANTTAAGSAGLEQSEQQNWRDALGAIPGMNASFMSPAQAQLGAANAGYQLPFQNLSALLGPLLGIAGMGSQGFGVSNTSAESSPWGNIIGGGLGLLSLFSDERMKEDIEEVGEMKDGQPIYRYRMKGSPKFEIGLLAQDVERRRPGAVSRDPVSGFKMVNYKTATDRAAEHRRAA